MWSRPYPSPPRAQIRWPISSKGYLRKKYGVRRLSSCSVLKNWLGKERHEVLGCCNVREILLSCPSFSMSAPRSLVHSPPPNFSWGKEKKKSRLPQSSISHSFRLKQNGPILLMRVIIARFGELQHAHFGSLTPMPVLLRHSQTFARNEGFLEGLHSCETRTKLSLFYIGWNSETYNDRQKF